MWPPPLFRDLEPGHRALNAVVMPILFGVLCGWILGVSEGAYLVLTTLGIAGGVAGGFEHLGAREGALRGVVGGVLFASSILLTNAAIGADPEAKLPDPEILLVVVFGAIGCGLGAFGGFRRARREQVAA